mgnify:CR=1 FL=1
MKTLLCSLDGSIFNVLTDIRSVLNDKGVTDTEKVAHIDKLVPNKDKAIEKSNELKDSMTQLTDEKHYFEILASRSIRLQNRISPIVKSLDFQAEPGATSLMDAITHFRVKAGHINKYAPLKFMDEEQRFSLFADGTFHKSLYKVFLFIHIASALKSGMLNLKHSHKYRPLDDYMISKERWTKEKDTLIARAELQEFVSPSSLLDTLDDALNQQYHATNTLHFEGKNQHLKVGKNSTFTISTPKQEEDLEKTALQPFFPDSPIPLVEVLSTVNQHSSFFRRVPALAAALYKEPCHRQNALCRYYR